MIALLVLLAVFLVFVVSVGSEIRRKKSFEQRFPPITEAEFIARCTPGIDPSVALRVRRLVADCLGVEYERIYPSSRFVDDLGAD